MSNPIIKSGNMQEPYTSDHPYETATLEFWRNRIRECRSRKSKDPIRAALGQGSNSKEMIERSKTILESFFKSGHKILDVGCGCGDLVLSIPSGVEYVGVDLVPEFVEEAIRSYQRPGVQFLVGDMSRPSESLSQFPDGYFDGVVGRLVEATVGNALGRFGFYRMLNELFRVGNGQVLFWSPQFVTPRIYVRGHNKDGSPDILQLGEES